MFTGIVECIGSKSPLSSLSNKQSSPPNILSYPGSVQTVPSDFFTGAMCALLLTPPFTRTRERLSQVRATLTLRRVTALKLSLRWISTMAALMMEAVEEMKQRQQQQQEVVEV